jgi:hypothetical protein
MICEDYHASGTVFGAAEPLRLWETAKGYVEIGKNTLAVPIMRGYRPKGYVFQGHSRLVLDTIIETEEGAVGKPVEKEIARPFLMLGNTETIQHCLVPAGNEDLTEMGYTKQEELVAKAEDLLNRLSGRKGRIHSSPFSRYCNASVFAFQNETDKLDILVAKGEKLVYKAMNTIFVSNRDRTILKERSGLICVSDGRSIIVKR